MGGHKILDSGVFQKNTQIKKGIFLEKYFQTVEGGKYPGARLAPCKFVS